jgi:hypothetical protein
MLAPAELGSLAGSLSRRYIGLSAYHLLRI